jgi:hypothetical protein
MLLGLSWSAARTFIADDPGNLKPLPGLASLPAWLPQKQGLCQVVKMPDLVALSDF